MPPGLRGLLGGYGLLGHRREGLAELVFFGFGIVGEDDAGDAAQLGAGLGAQRGAGAGFRGRFLSWRGLWGDSGRGLGFVSWLEILSGIPTGSRDVGASDLNGLRACGTDFDEAVELGQGAGAGSFEAGGGALDGRDVAFDSLLGEGDAVVLIEAGVFAVVLKLVLQDADVIDTGFDGPSAADAPLGDGDMLDEMEFEDGAGLEGIDIIMLELFKKGVILITEDDSSGGKAVLYGILGGTLLAFRRDRTYGLGAIAAGSFYLCFGSHCENETSCDQNTWWVVFFKTVAS